MPWSTVMLNGVLIIDKPAGFTSHDVVAKLRGILRQRRVGHAGTLDPMATGVLVGLLGAATRASDDAAAADKEYDAALRLGITTDTQDIWGRVTEERPVPPQVDLEAALSRFRGDILQQPPMYSAVQINGQRLYKLARKGIEVERPSRRVTIHRLDCSGRENGDYLLTICCSKGTYIRTLCHDIGRALDCGGVMTALRRIRAGAFDLNGALTLDLAECLHRQGQLEAKLLPADQVYRDLPALFLNEEGARRARNGNPLGANLLERGEIPGPCGRCRIYDHQERFLMTGVVRQGGLVFCDKTFYPGNG